jgi:hypothetical protein
MPSFAFGGLKPLVLLSLEIWAGSGRDSLGLAGDGDESSHI